jgi:tetratricopeptide (TPR) repeat protein
MDPYFLLASTYISLPYVECGMYDEAVEVMKRAEPLAAGNAFTLGMFGMAYGMAGRREKALEILDALDEMARERYVSPLHYANVFFGFGDTNKTIDYLEKAYAERSPMLILVKASPWVDPLRSNQRFQSLLKKIGL